MPIKCSVFIATTVDGFIAREDGCIDWLISFNTLVPSGEDGGYKSFISTVDGLVMGRNSYEQVLSFDEWPYGDLPVVVMTSKALIIPEHLQKCVSLSAETPSTLVQRLAKKGMKHLYIDGGITIQRFITEQLIDELTITLIPILLGSGRSLFGPLKQDIDLELLDTKNIGYGIVQLKYRIMPPKAHST
ncbi:dihydrofolate reductase family protein [Fluoribacter gormanii]|uniref:Dihydrofolate reductase n=1 Tax=Fluoribacter gormanii TaxID=464 RepID=A0A377GI46_9GAMM|nr:dihydrofolate reductase family protein [Fluoribacter gormanii]KTD03472.1 dihydrofolate reductase and methyltransferase [Fluoribacter gormanii]MCW8443939.1 dihydrofolate reductase family protein [Fluoribacter gormanii]MCW8469123.1 dihydrofolate reductase family protein [Fluoribacter gormanii]SIQ47192.1 Dihydrofolate reductase [Fluoribacter gormanii]STO24500.1 Pyrimidine deaminase [Fluoribacter gormanii]